VIDAILKENPILLEPNFKTRLDAWEKIKDAVERKHPNLKPEEQAAIIGGIIERLKS
tara:strand:- start:423 stop:593 length:171 start_codon:yes stop_codon:yes gene_type:complete